MNIIKSLILLTFLVTILSQIKTSEQANLGKDLVINISSSIKWIQADFFNNFFAQSGAIKLLLGKGSLLTTISSKKVGT